MNSIKSIAGTAHPVVLGMCLPVVLFSNDTIKSGQLIYKNNLLMASVQDRHKEKTIQLADHNFIFIAWNFHLPLTLYSVSQSHSQENFHNGLNFISFVFVSILLLN